jgi:hypothetical protein
MGPTPAAMTPGAAVTVQAIGLQKAAPESPEVLTADAAVVNPAPKRAKQK